MFTATRIALSVAIVLGAASAAHAAGVPSINIERMCRASEVVSFADNTATFDTCLSDEQAAHKQLVKDWTMFAATDKARCVLLAEYLPSYVEWLTCLEMELEFRKIRNYVATNKPAPAPSSSRYARRFQRGPGIKRRLS